MEYLAAMKFFMCVFCIGAILILFAVNQHPYVNSNDTVPPADSLFTDTIYPIVTTSFTPDYGELHECPRRIRHYFKFIGDSVSFITRYRTSDPQYISNCSAGRGPLKKNTIYYFDVAFPWHNRLGKVNRIVGLEINQVPIMFRMKFDLVEDTCGRINN